MGKKRKPQRLKPPKDSHEYFPGPSKEERAANHRKTEAASHARGGPALRERRRIAMAERRAALKALKRRWDPPKLTKKFLDFLAPDRESPEEAPPDSHQDHHTGADSSPESRPSCRSALPPPDPPRGTSPTACMDSEEYDDAALEAAANSRPLADRNSAASPTAEERIAVEALTILAQPAAAEGDGPASAVGSVDSVLEKAMLLSSSRYSAAGAPPAASAEPWVQRALQQVATLNAEPLVSPTAFDRTFWSRGDHELFSGRYLTGGQFLAIRLWRGRSERAARRRAARGGESSEESEADVFS
ncbi:hypothetical protein B0H13DRAFT_2377314 [Mycena leptocephala]|nr:hypothetical protein B0H13DRAFT_2377314 [Mycena leptocephala]